ncbi:hypothetical protein [Acidovorax sp. NCPPB 4044]|uniref:hypothetical protein n=1 Tax=Acidovorax sp. NCPPB 4044 TaxID=2940490 RepID=UPI002303B380|nr:hypothetical protein [Acidovorax sp. NCPPB 4044]MDA8521898.1 hypothetical protein [Acidovorax sp. NCPPB 4044]
MSPDHLPAIADLRRTAQSLAMLDAILCAEWEYRYYSFDACWDDGEAMASMRDGCGDDWFVLFDGCGAAIKGFAHELAAGSDWPREIQRQVPDCFSSFLDEPAFSMHHATFCYWRQQGDTGWSKVSGFGGEDGARDLLELLISGPSGYVRWAEAYYECPVPQPVAAAIFSHEPLTDAVVLALNPDAGLAAVRAEAGEIGYPIAGRHTS